MVSAPETFCDQPSVVEWYNCITVLVDYNTSEGDTLLSTAMTREMLTALDGDYGLGFGIVATGDGITFGHGGANHGFRCRLLRTRWLRHHDERG